MKVLAPNVCADIAVTDGLCYREYPLLYFYYIFFFYLLYIVIMRLGVHLRKGRFITIEKAAETTLKYSKFNCIQIHTHGPTHKRERKINPEAFSKILKLHNACIMVHASSLTYPWKNTSTMDKHVFAQMEKSHILGAVGIVIHLPKLEPEGLMPKLLFLVKKNNEYKKKYRTKTIIILEMTSQKPSKHSYETPEKINNLIDTMKLHAITYRDVGICIDTAHIFVNKKVNIREYDPAKKYLNKIKNPGFIKLIHLNGNSRSGYSDCHEIPFTRNDLIWRNISLASSGLLAFIEFAESRRICIILEMETRGRNAIKKFVDTLSL